MLFIVMLLINAAVSSTNLSCSWTNGNALDLDILETAAFWIKSATSLASNLVVLSPNSPAIILSVLRHFYKFEIQRFSNTSLTA